MRGLIIHGNMKFTYVCPKVAMKVCYKENPAGVLDKPQMGHLQTSWRLDGKDGKTRIWSLIPKKNGTHSIDALILRS